MTDIEKLREAVIMEKNRTRCVPSSDKGYDLVLLDCAESVLKGDYILKSSLPSESEIIKSLMDALMAYDDSETTDELCIKLAKAIRELMERTKG